MLTLQIEHHRYTRVQLLCDETTVKTGFVTTFLRFIMANINNVIAGRSHARQNDVIHYIKVYEIRVQALCVRHQ